VTPPPCTHPEVMADGYLGKHGWSGSPDDGQPFDPLPGADPPAWRGRTAIGLCEACGELVALVHTWDPAEPWHPEHGRPSDRLPGWITLTPVDGR
jgi:hypothetical protein